LFILRHFARFFANVWKAVHRTKPLRVLAIFARRASKGDNSAMSKRILGLDFEGILPFAIGAAGVAYYALQAHAPHGQNGNGSPRAAAEWEKHVQTGQLVAIAALSTGVLVFRLGKRS